MRSQKMRLYKRLILTHPLAITEVYHVYVPALSYRFGHGAKCCSRQKEINLYLVVNPVDHHLILVQASRHRPANSFILTGI